jgi:hypothetical protein
MPKPKGRPKLVANGKSLVMQRRSRVEKTVLMPAYLHPLITEYVQWVGSVEKITEDEAMGSLMEVAVGGIIEQDRDFQSYLRERDAKREASAADTSSAHDKTESKRAGGAGPEGPNGGKAAGGGGLNTSPPAKSNGATSPLA